MLDIDNSSLPEAVGINRNLKPCGMNSWYLELLIVIKEETLTGLSGTAFKFSVLLDDKF